MRAAAAGAVAAVTTAFAENSGIGLSPRRFVAGCVMLVGLGLARLAVSLLPKDAPTRVFVTGMIDAVPVTWRDLGRFARRRPTRSTVA